MSDPITVTVQEAKRLSGLGHTKIWELIKDGRLEVVRVDRRTLVVYASLQKLLTEYEFQFSVSFIAK